ncbi:MAG: hypothetical protein ACM359_09370 [Bacillota bacterium]
MARRSLPAAQIAKALDLRFAFCSLTAGMTEARLVAQEAAAKSFSLWQFARKPAAK